MRLERGAVWVPGWVRRGLFPFFEKETPALELELGVGAAWGGLGVMIYEQVLEGDREGAEPVGSQEKHHAVWEDVEREVGPVLRGRPCL